MQGFSQNSTQNVSQPTLFELKSQLDRAIADVDYFKPRLKWRRGVDIVPNKKLPSAEKLVINALQEQYFANSNRKPDNDGFYRVHIGDNVIQTDRGPKQLRGLGYWTGLDRQAVGDILKKLHAKGVIVRKEIPPSKEDITSRIYIRPTELFSLEGFNNLFDGDYGGKREKGKFKCKECGGYVCEVKVTTTRVVQTTCAGCGDVQLEKPETTIKKYTIDASEDDQEPEPVKQSVHNQQAEPEPVREPQVEHVPAEPEEVQAAYEPAQPPGVSDGFFTITASPEAAAKREELAAREFAWKEQQEAAIKEQPAPPQMEMGTTPPPPRRCFNCNTTNSSDFRWNGVRWICHSGRKMGCL